MDEGRTSGDPGLWTVFNFMRLHTTVCSPGEIQNLYQRAVVTAMKLQVFRLLEFSI